MRKRIRFHKMKTLLTIIPASFLAAEAFAQNAAWKFPCPTNEIARHTAHRITEKIRIDGRLGERAWQRAPTSPRFVAILGGQRTNAPTAPPRLTALGPGA